jgi:hypothetical protein
MARGIGLPDFEHSVGDRFSISVEDLATNGDAFTSDAFSDEIISFEINHTKMKKWANGLR